MSRRDCERWASIADREALEIEVSADDARFSIEHARLCQACSAELSAWRDLESQQAGPTPAAERDLLLEDAVLTKFWSELGATESRPTPVRAKSRHGLALGLALGATAAAAAAGIFFVSSRLNGTATSVARVVVGSGSSLTARSAARRIGEAVAEGETLRAGGSPACLLIEPGVRACLSAGGELRIADTALAHRRLELVRGTVVASLSPQPAGTSFSISTGGTVVTAVGTIFSVEVATSGGPVKVRVLRGSVKVRSAGANERVLGAHQELAFGAQPSVGSTAAAEANDLALLRDDPELAAAAAEAPWAAAPVASTPAKPEALSSAGGARTNPVAEPLSSGEPLGPGELLRHALELRAAQRFAEAANVYRKLIAQQPRSAEARTALVSLGDLQLSRLSDAASALKSFDAYLSSGDRALEQEAQYGRIRALRALGRGAEEQLAIERLLSSYPAGVHAEPMRQRLQSLNGNAGH